ncbi:hypothetical protein JD844_013482 [Phrynosoma platyrhinos]|uniref:MATH domain-containing protein n=1 Tax=Phrynosoma platyrhinos TaxID=52577 RepID=A0ABQ7TLB5_PHRPL|nr:hypothetical protein JD844_013482 [Phrynosoma platyrhinos]
MTLDDAMPQVSLHYQQMPASEQAEETRISQQHPHLLEVLHQLANLDFPLDKLWERLRTGLPFNQKVAELENRQKTLENIVSVLSRELGRREDVPGLALGEAMARILYLEEKVEQQDSLLALKDVMISNLVSRIHTLEQTTYNGCFLWKVPEVGLRTQEAQAGNRPALYSPGEHTLWLFFVYQVTLTLLDQENKHHISTSFRPLESSSSFQQPVSETNVASGLPEFCPLNLLHCPRTSYIQNDTLAIQAVIDTET